MVEIISILVIKWDICKRYTANTVLKDKTKFIPPYVRKRMVTKQGCLLVSFIFM